MSKDQQVLTPKERTAGSELFIVDNSDEDWKVRQYLHDWCQLSQGIDVATGYFEIGSLLTLDGEWQKVDQIRLLMGDEVSRRTKKAFVEGLEKIKSRLDQSLESEKEKLPHLFFQGEARDQIVDARFNRKRWIKIGRGHIACLCGRLGADCPSGGPSHERAQRKLK